MLFGRVTTAIATVTIMAACASGGSMSHPPLPRPRLPTADSSGRIW